ncbi:MAG: glucoamylase family protein [Bacilli bacterium]|nr:glucoamylase family protein [Bacilli bacterium]
MNINKKFRKITNHYKSLTKMINNHYFIGIINEWIVDNYYLLAERFDKLNRFRKNKKLYKYTYKNVDMYTIIGDILETNHYLIDEKTIIKELDNYQKKFGYDLRYKELDIVPNIIETILIGMVSNICEKEAKKLKEQKKINKLIIKLKIELLNKNKISLSDYFDVDNTTEYSILYLNEHLKELGDYSNLIFKQLDELLNERNMSIRDIINSEHTDNVEVNIVIKNIFQTLNNVSFIDRDKLYEKLNDIERVLKKDKFYSQMTIETKERYRSYLKEKSKKGNLDLVEFLNDSFEDSNNISASFNNKDNYKLKFAFYLGIILVPTVVLSYYLSIYLTSYRWIGFLILLIPFSEIIITIVQKMFLTFYKPQIIPKLNFSKGIPDEYKTMVVIPTIIKNEKRIEQVFESLEKYYLVNKTKNLYFTLLGDCFENKYENHENDPKIVAFGYKRVKELNDKYGADTFNFIYRRRKYNEGEGSWLGFERKRGALLHFNDLLLGNLTESEKQDYFKGHTFDDFNHRIKYIITLDVDTQLGLDAAWKLVGAMAHPLNKPILNEAKNKVIKGYGILQPRLSTDVESSNESLFSQLYAGIGGLDPYNYIFPSFYQDVFNEGSFCGKGIYDLEVTNQVLKNRFPLNLILSHDLLEGNYLSCGNIVDVELIDDFPSQFLVDASRRSRWGRGDMQIVGWIRGKVKNTFGEYEKNPITALGKWKIFDNIRRGLVDLNLTLIILISLLNFTNHSIWWFGFVMLVCIFPLISQIMEYLMVSRNLFSSLKYYSVVMTGAKAIIIKFVAVFAAIPYNAKLYVTSFSKALYRMFISKKHLLNWITADDAAKFVKTNLSNTIKQFSLNYFLALLILIYSLLFGQFTLIHLTVILLFIFGPIIIYLISQPLNDKKTEIDDENKKYLNDIAVKTWNFFEDQLTEENNYLIPDNYQLNRDIKEDIKTSPTNIGMSLISIISAHELEFIDLEKSIHLIKNVICNVDKLSKWHGHLYNWYNIRTMEVMQPRFISSVDSGNFVASLMSVKGYLKKHNQIELLKTVERLISKTDFKWLYTDLDVLSIGYDIDKGYLEPFNYNKFMSESRIGSYVAIAKGDIPLKHWFSLDKTLIAYKKQKGLSSWSGTSFEYFMPLIFMKSYENTILDESYHFAHFAQVDFMKNINPKHPWGISESAYNELDDGQNYKYKAFGIPQLKLKEEPLNRIVVSPYSSILAISLFPKNVISNLNKFDKLSMEGEYGFYESYDFFDNVPVKAYFSHHQGMILSSLANFLKDGAIQKYFNSDIQNQAIEILNKERVQLRPYIDFKIQKYKKYTYKKEPFVNDIRVFRHMSILPELSVLSNSKYSVIINDQGIGYSKYRTIQLNRYRKVTEQDYGLFMYVKDLHSKRVWSNTYAPSKVKPNNYEIVFALDKVKFVRTDKDVITTTEIVVTRSHNAEIRKITFKNNSNKDKYLELTSYTEPILCQSIEDISHPAFNNLFVYSEYDEETNSIIVNRKLRDSKNQYYMINRLLIDEPVNEFEYETNRSNFIGRGHTAAKPKGLNQKLRNYVGTVLDPIISLRNTVKVPKNKETTVYLISGFGKSKKQVLDIVNTYSNKQTIIEKGFEEATIMSNITSKMVNITVNDMRLYNTMLNYLLQTRYITINEEVFNNLRNNTLNQRNLWTFGISGDRPIILLNVQDLEDLSLIKELLHAFEYYKSKSVLIDLVVINSPISEHAKIISKEIEDEKYHMYALNSFFKIPGDIHVLDRDSINEEEYNLLRTVSRLTIDGKQHKSLQEYINVLQRLNTVNIKKIEIENHNSPVVYDKSQIKYFNEYGGFINNGKEYLITNQNTPHAWSNVISNKNFGTIITNNNCGFTYALNSQEYKLTSWSNDVLIRDSSEGFKINDIGINFNLVKHGFGYSQFSGNLKKLDIKLTQFVATEDNVKLYKIELKNNSARKQKVALKFWINPNLGFTEEKTSRYLLSDFNEEDNFLSIRNVYSQNFSNIYTFMSSNLKIDNVLNNNLLFKEIEVSFYLDEKEERELSFMLGATTSDNLQPLVKKYSDVNVVNKEFDKVVSNWNERLTKVQVKTPDDSFNYMVNGWALYQSMASRIQAKAGYYQVGGAFGYRDQLQDSMNICSVEPSITREQIIINAKHQFAEGDVLHWWHVSSNSGLRSLYKDDFLWLVYATSEYINITEDMSILDELIPFVEGSSLEPGEHEKLIDYRFSEESVSLYEHCKLSIHKAMNELGENGLPLMGGGDWNDGMNKIGIEGKGTSVWLGFFLYMMVEKFINITKKYNDKISVSEYLDFNKKLKGNLRKNAWDGHHYVRAFFDNENVVGSHVNEECSIDLISQSFAILSGVADNKQNKIIVDAVEKELVDKDLRIIKLLTPAFKNNKDYPGYIMDYPKGIRENGGQYTHATAWYIMALLKLNKPDLAYKHYQMINPINRTLTPDDVLKYKVEPYVFAADVYSNEQFKAQGGWTWYTGTSAWFYKVALVDILGFSLRGNKLYIKPNVSKSWDKYSITYKYKETIYEIEVLLNNPNDEIILDNEVIKTDFIELEDDKKIHKVVVKVGEKNDNI